MEPPLVPTLTQRTLYENRSTSALSAAGYAASTGASATRVASRTQKAAHGVDEGLSPYGVMLLTVDSHAVVANRFTTLIHLDLKREVTTGRDGHIDHGGVVFRFVN